MDQTILIVHRFQVFPNKKHACSHVGGDACGKEHGTLISTHLVTQIMRP